jgi:hypothetical protein
MARKLFYKLARPDGFDFKTGNTINYREAIGKTVKVPAFDKEPQLCSDSVLHACLDPNNCFVGAKIPCSVFKVTGKPVVDDGSKCGFKELKVVEEIPQDRLDELFGWKYTEACNPLNPLAVKAPKVGPEVLKLLQNWDSVWDSVWASVRDSVWASVRDSVLASVRDSVLASVWASVWDSVWDSVWASVWDSVRASVWDSVRASEHAYLGSLFPKIKKWKYMKHKAGVYPFQACVDLLRLGFIPSFNGKVWRLHAGPKALPVYEVTREQLKKILEA